MISVPESVLAYFEQASVQTAVDLLLTGREPKVPKDLQWADVPAFYRACMAATQVRAEFAIFTEQLWRAAWGEAPSGWCPCTPADPARADLAIGIAEIWSQSCFSRRFERGGCALELSAGLFADQGLRLGILLYDPEESVLIPNASLPGWDRENDCDTYWTITQITPLASEISPLLFAPLRDQALNAVEQAMAGSA